VPGRGRLIVLEGGEGSGKSTQAAILADRIGALLTREPGGTALGERLRPLLLGEAGPLDPLAELLLFSAARAEHCAERIRPALARGEDVVCDRFSGSTIAYQGYGRGIALADVRRASQLATAGLTADLTILLDVTLEVSAARRAHPGDAIEAAGRDFHVRVLEGFRELARSEPATWVVIDGAAPREVVAEEVYAAVLMRLGSPS